MAKDKNAITVVVKHHRKWIAENSERIYQRELEYLEKDLADASIQAMQNVADSLATLATFFGIKGTVGVLDDKADGWECIGRSLSYHFWCLKLRVESFFKMAQLQPNLTNYTSRMASMLCYAIVSNRTTWESYLVEALATASRRADALDDGYWKRRLFEPFVLALECYKAQRNWATEDSSRDFGPYSSIVKNWDGEKFPDSLAAVCDYHCRNMEDVGGRWNPEFKYSPFDVLAMEVFAIVKVRPGSDLQKLGINHPLLNTPLAKVEQIPTPPEDDTVRQVRLVNSNLFND